MKSIYLPILLIVLSSCTAYRNNHKVGPDEQLLLNELKNLAVNDKVSLRLRTGQSLTGKIISIGEQYMIVQAKRTANHTIYFQQVSHIKYKVSQPMTALKVIGGLAIVSIIILLLFQPDINGFMI